MFHPDACKPKDMGWATLHEYQTTSPENPHNQTTDDILSLAGRSKIPRHEDLVKKLCCGAQRGCQ